jgi:hypothetical protein
MIPTSWPYPPQTYEAYAAIDRAGFTHYYCPTTTAECPRMNNDPWQ